MVVMKIYEVYYTELGIDPRIESEPKVEDSLGLTKEQDYNPFKSN